ncbi:hypothetical protein C400_01485, partial [Paenibacillus sp. ICGEB2008]
CTIQRAYLLMNKGEVDIGIHFAKQMILGHQFFQGNQFKGLLFVSMRSQHTNTVRFYTIVAYII